MHFCPRSATLRGTMLRRARSCKHDVVDGQEAVQHGDWSVESQYVTAGQAAARSTAAAAAQQAASAPGTGVFWRLAGAGWDVKAGCVCMPGMDVALVRWGLCGGSLLVCESGGRGMGGRSGCWGPGLGSGECLTTLELAQGSMVALQPAGCQL